MTRKQVVLLAGITLGVLVLAARPLAAATLKLSLPLGRTAYQTNEPIDVCVVRSDTEAMGAADMKLTLAASDGSRIGWCFLSGGGRQPWSGHGASAPERLAVPSGPLQDRRRDQQRYRLDRDRYLRPPSPQHLQDDRLGLPRPGARDGYPRRGRHGLQPALRRLSPASQHGQREATLRGGADYMQCCTMSGGHQMDLRQECDWSDPYVLKGATARAAQQAFMDRTKPNALGVHSYDEPGLTWEKRERRTRSRPSSAHSRAPSAATAFPTRPSSRAMPRRLAKWQFWGRWKEGFLEAAWKDARFAVDQVKPELISATQSQYAWNGYTDGYYFNVVRPLGGHQRARRLRRRAGQLFLSRLPPGVRPHAAVGQAKLVSAELGQHPPATSCTGWNNTCVS